MSRCADTATMTTFEWTTRLAVGFPRMDEQHIWLIDLMNQLQTGIEAGAPPDRLLQQLDQLGTLARQHFREEEEVMQSIAYPNLELHKMLHVALLERFAAHRDEAAATGRFTPEFQEFLFQWLTGHIKGPDTKYGVHSGNLTAQSR